MLNNSIGHDPEFAGRKFHEFPDRNSVSDFQVFVVVYVIGVYVNAVRHPLVRNFFDSDFAQFLVQGDCLLHCSLGCSLHCMGVGF